MPETKPRRLSYDSFFMPKIGAWSAVLFAAFACAAAAQRDSSWTEPFASFRIAGNLYFVGTRGVSSFLLTTPEGHILIDTGLEQAMPQVARNVENLGFAVRDIKIILSSHAHFDHVEGHAEMQRRTGATVMAIGEDAAALASGRDNSALGGPSWKPVRVGRVLRDGDTVTLGGKPLRVVFVGGTSVNSGVRLLDNTRHPSIVADYERTFRVLKELAADIFLAQHPTMFDMERRWRA